MRKFERSPRSGPTLIVGAGVTGLTLARELRALGHEVHVIEAKSRAGGRVETLRSPLRPGAYADVGAARVPATHARALALIGRLGLETVAFEPIELGSRDIVDGRAVDSTSGLGAPLSEYPLECSALERRLGAMDAMRHYLAHLRPVLGDCAAPDWPAAGLADLDAVPIDDFMRNAGASDDLQRLIRLGYRPRSGRTPVSALGYLRTVFVGGLFAPQVRIVGGFDQLTESLLANCDAPVSFDTEALAIRRSADGVALDVSAPEGSRTLHGAQVVVTAPITPLRRIRYPQAFEEEKRAALELVGVQPATRVVFEVADLDWTPPGQSGFARTEHPSTVWTHPSPAGGGVVQVYIKEEPAWQLAGVSDEERIAHGLAHLAEVFPDAPRAVCAAAVKCWQSDSFAGGSATYFPPGALTRHLHRLRRPCAGVVLAGDMLSPWPGWIEGALWSASHVLAQLLDVAPSECEIGAQ